MKKLPVFLSLEGKEILVVGGGRAALIKIKTLLKIEANFHVIAKTYSKDTEELLKSQNIVYKQREIVRKDLEDIFIVFAAAEKNINEMIEQWAKEKNVLCCKADGTGDFIVPYHKREGNLTIAVSTDGLFPLLGRKFCEKIDLSIGNDLEYLGEQRKKILQETEDKQEIKRMLEYLLEEYQKNEKSH